MEPRHDVRGGSSADGNDVTTVVPRRVTLLRHGEAQAPDSCPEDFERALTRHGANEARAIGERILRRNLIPDLILVSPAERAWSTAEIVAAACELDAKQLQCARELYLRDAGKDLETARPAGFVAPSHPHLRAQSGLEPAREPPGADPHPARAGHAALATAVWLHGEWDTLQPETAAACELDDPESSIDFDL